MARPRDMPNYTTSAKRESNNVSTMGDAGSKLRSVPRLQGNPLSPVSSIYLDAPFLRLSPGKLARSSSSREGLLVSIAEAFASPPSLVVSRPAVSAVPIGFPPYYQSTEGLAGAETFLCTNSTLASCWSPADRVIPPHLNGASHPGRDGS